MDVCHPTNYLVRNKLAKTVRRFNSTSFKPGPRCISQGFRTMHVSFLSPRHGLMCRMVSPPGRSNTRGCQSIRKRSLGAFSWVCLTGAFRVKLCDYLDLLFWPCSSNPWNTSDRPGIVTSAKLQLKHKGSPVWFIDQFPINSLRVGDRRRALLFLVRRRQYHLLPAFFFSADQAIG